MSPESMWSAQDGAGCCGSQEEARFPGSSRQFRGLSLVHMCVEGVKGSEGGEIFSSSHEATSPIGLVLHAYDLILPSLPPKAPSPNVVTLA